MKINAPLMGAGSASGKPVAVTLWKLFWTVIACLLVTNGCFPKASAPIPMLTYGPMDASGNKHLMILLRGMGGSPEDFFEYGIIQELQSRGLSFDVVVPNAHFGYYRSRTLEERLKNDVIQPARLNGYRQIWLAGFSMGGLGSLFYLKQHQDDLDGVLLISPFMGWQSILGQIEASGGVRHWIPKKNSDKWQHLIWGWVKTYAAHPDDYPPVFLGYGTRDGMVGKGPVLLGDALPKTRIFTVPGRHDYKTFISIWKIHLDRLEQRFEKLSKQ